MARQDTGRTPSIASFDLKPGRVLARKYEVISRLGAGWEGEVFLVRELATDIERAVKLFYPQRNPRDRVATFYARKLHKLRHCPMVIQYHTAETILYRKIPVTLLVSDYVEGILLSEFLQRQPGKRLAPFQGLHSDNIIIQRYGLGFDLKLLDFYHWGSPKPENIHDDVVDLVKLLHEAVGGSKHYAKQPKEIKGICRGLKRSLILENFRTAGELREYLESLEWC